MNTHLISRALEYSLKWLLFSFPLILFKSFFFLRKINYETWKTGDFMGLSVLHIGGFMLISILLVLLKYHLTVRVHKLVRSVYVTCLLLSSKYQTSSLNKKHNLNYPWWRRFFDNNQDMGRRNAQPWLYFLMPNRYNSWCNKSSTLSLLVLPPTIPCSQKRKLANNRWFYSHFKSQHTIQ